MAGISELEREHMRAELYQLIRDVSEVEEIPMAQIQELANAHVIDVTAYSQAWDKLCLEAWKVVEVAEERMEGCDEY